MRRGNMRRGSMRRRDPAATVRGEFRPAPGHGFSRAGAGSYNARP